MSIDEISCSTKLTFCLILLLASGLVPQKAFAQDEDLDDYKVRISGIWFHSTPTVTMEAAGRNGLVDFNRDFGFNDYSTFGAKFDWKFTRKNHLYFVVSDFNQTQEAVLNRTITFRGQTFVVGLNTQAQLHEMMYSPGYQYDIIRRNRGHLGLAVQFNIFDTSGTFSAAAQTTPDGVNRAAVASQASLKAPIPVAGPEYRFYITRSPRIFVEGYVFGMYFFGYGNFVSTTNDLGVSLGKHFGIKAGYAVGSRLQVNTTSKRVGLNLTQKGPIVGVEVSF
jgi:hypothetical protein